MGIDAYYRRLLAYFSHEGVSRSSHCIARAGVCSLKRINGRKGCRTRLSCDKGIAVVVDGNSQSDIEIISSQISGVSHCIVGIESGNKCIRSSSLIERLYRINRRKVLSDRLSGNVKAAVAVDGDARSLLVGDSGAANKRAPAKIGGIEQ